MLFLFSERGCLAVVKRPSFFSKRANTKIEMAIQASLLKLSAVSREVIVSEKTSVIPKNDKSKQAIAQTESHLSAN